MPWTSELAQLPTPAMARRMGLWLGLGMGVSSVLVGLGGRVGGDSGGRRRGPLRLDQRVEPADVAGGPVGGVLDDGAGVDIEIGRTGGRLGLPEALDQVGPPALEQGQTGLRGQVAGEGQAQAEAAGVVAGPAAAEELGEELPAGVGDAVHLLAP